LIQLLVEKSLYKSLTFLWVA